MERHLKIGTSFVEMLLKLPSFSVTLRSSRFIAVEYHEIQNPLPFAAVSLALQQDLFWTTTFVRDHLSLKTTI